MAVAEVKGIEGLKELIGTEIGPGEWREVRQQDIDTFADLSGDHQWIHVDTERAKQESPFGTTIAHGNLTLSMIDGFRLDLITTTGFKLGVNYGWNKVRFPAPVPAGSRVRAKAEVISVDEVGGGWWQVVTRFTVEVEGSDKPCCVADSVGRALALTDVQSSAARSTKARHSACADVRQASSRRGSNRSPVGTRSAIADVAGHSPAPTAASAAAPVAVASTAPRSTGVPPASA